MTIKVFLLDDHELVRRGIVDLISAHDDVEVVGEASTGDEAMRADPAVAARRGAARRAPGRPRAHGHRDLPGPPLRAPGVACLMLTSYSDDDALVASVLAGAAGYLLKQIRGPAADRLDPPCSRRCVAVRGVTWCAKVLERLRAPVDDPLDALSGQERRILDLIAEGLTNRQIGEQLFLAEKTVKNYVSNLLAKLGMSRRTEAAAFAARLDERERLETKPWS